MSPSEYEQYTATAPRRAWTDPRITFNDLSVPEDDKKLPGLHRSDAIRLPPGTEVIVKEGDGSAPSLTRSNAVRKPKRDTNQEEQATDKDGRIEVPTSLKRSKTQTGPNRKNGEPALPVPRPSRFMEHMADLEEDAVSSTASNPGNESNLMSRVKQGLRKAISHRPSYAGVQVFEGT